MSGGLPKLALSLQFARDLARDSAQDLARDPARNLAQDFQPRDPAQNATRGGDAPLTGLAAHRAALPRHAVARWLRHALARDAEITVRIVGEAEGRQLNRDFRHKDYATNVLTFGYAEQPVVMADLVLCAPVVAREARAQRKPLRAHYAHLLVHGALHAQGWDHETSAADARAMEARETQILQGLGFGDPWG